VNYLAYQFHSPFLFFRIFFCHVCLPPILFFYLEVFEGLPVSLEVLGTVICIPSLRKQDNSLCRSPYPVYKLLLYVWIVTFEPFLQTCLLLFISLLAGINILTEFSSIS